MGQKEVSKAPIEAPAHVGYDASDFDQDSFLRDLRSGDALAVVLRGQLYVEERLGRLVGGMCPKPDQLDSGHMRFQQLVAMGNAMGVLLPGQSSPLIALNKLRNRFAHDIGRSLTRDDVDVLYKSVSDLWFGGLLKGQRTGDEMEDLRTFVLTIVVGLTAKLQRVKRLKGQVVGLHMALLTLYATGGREVGNVPGE